MKPVYKFDFKTTSSDAVPSALQGSVYWYDTGTEVNSESVYYDRSDTYARWYDGTDWLISEVADVDGSPSNYFSLQDYPDTITITGDVAFNGTSEFAGFFGAPRPFYDASAGGGSDFVWEATEGGRWSINNAPYTDFVASTDYLPPKTGWPTVTLSYTIPTTQYVGQGAWSGTITYSEYTLSEAWDTAEDTVFASLTNYLGNTQDVDCYRGYLPINEDGQVERVNVWEITTGGTAGAFDVSRTYGENGNWCSVLTDGEIHGIFENRSKAMNFAGSIMQWLRATDNLKETGNVTWCHLADLPQSPEELIVDTEDARYRYWEVTIPIEMLYLTEGIHA